MARLITYLESILSMVVSSPSFVLRRMRSVFVNNTGLEDSHDGRVAIDDEGNEAAIRKLDVEERSLLQVSIPWLHVVDRDPGKVQVLLIRCLCPRHLHML